MSRKNSFIYQIEDNKSLAASFTSNPTTIKYLDNLGYQINITTSNSVGVFTIEGSNDYSVSEPGTKVTNPGTWVTLPLSGTPNANAANDSILIEMNQLPFGALRVKYTSSVAGTGTCDIFLAARQIGG